MAQLPTSALFVGRDAEMGEIARLLSDPACRLLTLVGPGGIGKTRLAVQSARQFPASEAVYFVPLQPLSSADNLILTIAHELNFQFYQGGDPEQQLLDYLHEKSWLMVLDNFEHLLDRAVLLSKILAYAPGVRMLVTSRERLNLVEEWVLEVGGLAYPSTENETYLERYSAVELFLHHARRVNVGFTLIDAQKSTISRICRLMGGMPLGIELAAAWVRALSCDEIARELERSLDILETPARNVEPRHRSIRVAFEPTWARLSDEERAAFRKLSVFRGGCTRQAAEAVAGASLRILSALVDKSLLRIDVNGRYDLHELLRQYADEQLNACGEADAARDAHCAYYAELLDRLATDLKGPTQVRALDEIEADLDNVRVSWRWAVTQGKEREVLQASDGLLRFYQMRSGYVEGAETFELAVNRFSNVESELLGQLLMAQGWFLQTSNSARALTCLKKGMTLLHPRDYSRIALTLLLLANFVEQFGGYEAVHQLYQHHLATARQNGDEWATAWALECMGYVAYQVENYSVALPYFQESLARFRALGDRWGSSWQYSSLGLVARGLNNYEEAQQYHLEHLALCQEAGDVIGIRWAFEQLGIVARRLGDLETSRRYTSDSLKLGLRLGFYEEVCWDPLYFAARHWMEAEKQPEQTVELLALLLHNSSRDARDKDILHILRLLDTLKALLPPEAFAAAVRRGEARNLTATAIELLEQLAAQGGQEAAIAPDAPTSMRSQDNPLTERELEVLRLIADGLSNREIADQRVLAVSTVKWYINEIFGKLEATSRTQAVARAKALGLLT